MFILLLTNVLAPDAYQLWGWRIPFLFGGAISLVGLYIRIRIAESPAFEAARTEHGVSESPLVMTFRQHSKALGFAFVISSLSGLGFYTLTGYFSTYLRESVGLSSNMALLSNSIALIVAFVAMPLGGLISDYVGRRQVLMWSAAGSAVVALPAYILAGIGSLGGAIGGQSLLAFTLGTFFGAFGIAILELFPTQVRYSGAAIGYNGAYLIFGGTAPLFSIWLVAVTGSLLAPAIYMAILAACVFVVTLRMPETYRQPL